MMQNRSLLLLFFSVFIVLSGCKKPQNDIVYSKAYIDIIKEVRKETGFYLASNFIPGASIAVMKDGELIYSEAIGVASQDLDVQADRTTLFRIGGLSELFTNVIYQKLVEEGKLNPDSLVQHYFPEFPEKEFPLKIQHLVHHTSGIREPMQNETNWRGLNVSLQKGIDNFKDDNFVAPPGAFQYDSPYNYNLLGAIMEKVTGKRYPELLEAYVIDTLNLKNTFVDNMMIPVKGRSDFFDHNMVAQVINATSIDLRWTAPSKGLLSNAEDLVKLGDAIMRSNYFSEETKSKLFQPVQLKNDIPSQSANGWMLLQDNKGRKCYGKLGSVRGGGASLLIYPEDQLAIAYTTNLTKGAEDAPIFKSAGKFLPQTEEAQK